MVSRVPLLFIQFFLCMIPLFSVAAEELDSKDRFQKVRTEYRELSINDPFLADMVLWRGVRARLLELSKESLDDEIASEVLYLKARVSEQIGKKLSDKFIVKEAESDFLRLFKEYSKSALADDALLGLTRVAAYFNLPEDRLRYAQIIKDQYSDSESIDKANQILEEAPVKLEKPFASQTKEVGDLLSNYPVIAIDPGHGGSELGANGPDGILEKDIVLKIAFLLKELLQKDSRLRVVMTRTKDDLVPLADRTKIANDAKAELFISIHANASEYKTSRGLETYYLDNTDDKSSLKLAERENFTAVGEAQGVGFIVSDFIQGVKIDDSISLAHLVHDNVYKELSTSFDGIKNLKVKKAPFFVLVGAHMPCVLVEVSFIDHPVEGRRMADPRYQAVIADGIYSGVKAYLKKKERIKE